MRARESLGMRKKELGAFGGSFTKISHHRAFETRCVPNSPTLSQVAIKAPSFGERRKSYLQDIAVATGATYVAEEVGLTLDQVGYGLYHLHCLRIVGSVMSFF